MSLRFGAGLALALGLTAGAQAATVVLPMYTDTVTQIGTAGGFPVYPQNTAVYTFTVATAGEVMAYYTGSTANDAEWLGLQTSVNGGPLVESGVQGLENHPPPGGPGSTATLGQAIDFGAYAAGTTLVFYIQDRSSQRFYSDPSLNLDGVGGAAVQHIYSTSFTADGSTDDVSTGGTDPSLFTVPTGTYTYVGFEDLPATDQFADFNYHDETFIFTDVSTNAPPTNTSRGGPNEPGGVPEPATWALMLAGFGGLGVALRRRRSAALTA